MSFRKARRSENCDAGTIKIETLEAMHKLKKESHCALEVFTTFPAAREKKFLGALDLTEQRR
jgi:hypothetical protein